MQSTDPHSHHSDARPDDQAGDQHAQQPGAPNAGQQGRGQPDPGQQGTGHQDTGATAAIIALEREVALLREERLRERADLENQRRRMVRDVEQARRFANERLLGDLLPVFDSLERGLEAAGTDANAASMREGVELTLRQLLKVAGDNGLQPVDPQGQAFDPERHQAMSTAESTDVPPGQVVQVFQKGYTLNERLLRPALVVVAKAPGD